MKDKLTGLDHKKKLEIFSKNYFQLEQPDVMCTNDCLPRTVTTLVHFFVQENVKNQIYSHANVLFTNRK